MRQPGEPSVDEILESIKKVIARDNRAEADDVGRQPRDAVSLAGVRTPDEPALDKPAIDSASGILDLSDTDDYAHEALEFDDPDDQDHDEPEIDSAPAPLVTEDARISMRDSLTALAMLSAPGAPPQIVRSGETSLEDMARELLRPALAEWLERNLPPLVERMVAAEIARIAGKRG